MSPERATTEHARPVPLPQFVGYFLWLGTVGFGGPIALAGHMQQDLVDGRGWISKQDYVEGLALAQLAPGPLAAQLAIYLGYVRARILGATLVGVAFVLPSFLMVLALSAAYVQYGGLSWMQGMFYGIGAAVIAIIARSAFKLTKLTLGKDRVLWVIFVALAISTAWTSQEIIWLFLLGGVVAVLVKALPAKVRASSPVNLLLAGLALPASGTLGAIFLYFAKAGMFVFGSGLAIVPFLYGGVKTVDHLRFRCSQVLRFADVLLQVVKLRRRLAVPHQLETAFPDREVHPAEGAPEQLRVRRRLCLAFQVGEQIHAIQFASRGRGDARGGQRRGKDVQ